MLRTLQGNVLRGHGRRAVANVFLRFDPARPAESRAFLRKLARKLTSASAQEADARHIRAARAAGRDAPSTEPFRACALSYAGYRALAVPSDATPANVPFRAGMKARGALLGDPDPSEWDPTFRGEVHALLLIGADPDPDDASRSAQLDAALAAALAALPNAVQGIGIERGRAYFNANGDGIEHFGYVDGRSQPLLRQADVDRELQTGSAFRWDPAFPLRQVLRADPGAPPLTSFGSYLVFRKLEQDVRGFKDAEAALGARLRALNPDFDPELAGAMLVGRFEDGTPLLLQRADGMHSPVSNDFDYAGDTEGLRCPFHAHIRKANPRGDTSRVHGVPIAEERAHAIARRGILYGARTQGEDGDFTDFPSHGVGLLFACHQSNIRTQFEVIQRGWANDAHFVRDDTGIDPLIGQARGGAQTHRAGWADPHAPTLTQRFADFVTLKGGEYFFTPSIAFLASL